MAAVEVREQTSASPNGRVRERYAEPTMTRAARETRAARRRAIPEAWRFDLEALYHYTAEYPYDPGHEYEEDWTTDPDYGIEGIHLCKFDAAGVELMADNRAQEIQRTAGNTAFDKLGDCVELETGVHYMTPDGVVRWVFPDLMVLPQVKHAGHGNRTAPCGSTKEIPLRHWCWRYCRTVVHSGTWMANYNCTPTWGSASTWCMASEASAGRNHRGNCCCTT